MTQGNESAFPSAEEWSNGFSSGLNRYPGLTKREMFAAMAMNGMQGSIWPSDSDMKEIARRAVIAADSLIQALNEKGGEVKLTARVHSMPMTQTSSEPVYRPRIYLDSLIQWEDLPQSVIESIVKGRTETLKLEVSIVEDPSQTGAQGE